MDSNTIIIVRGGYNKDKKELKPWNKAIKKLSFEDAITAKRLIMDRCGMTDMYYEMKKQGIRGITDREEESIQSILKALGVIWEPVAIEPKK